MVTLRGRIYAGAKVSSEVVMEPGGPVGEPGERVIGVFEFDDPAVDWLDQAEMALAMAGEFMLAGMGEEVVASAFLAMIYAARATLDAGRGLSSWRDVVEAFLGESLARLGLSKENQRSLPIVAGLYRRVSGGEVEADPLTSAACLEDARSFVGELAERVRGGD